MKISKTFFWTTFAFCITVQNYLGYGERYFARSGEGLGKIIWLEVTQPLHIFYTILNREKNCTVQNYFGYVEGYFARSGEGLGKIIWLG